MILSSNNNAYSGGTDLDVAGNKVAFTAIPEASTVVAALGLADIFARAASTSERSLA